MKYFNKLFIGLLAVGFSLAALGQNTTLPYSVFSTGSTNAGVLSWAIIGAHSPNNGIPVVTAINANSDKTGSKVQFYTVQRQTQVTTATNTTTEIHVQSTNGFSPSDVIIIRHVSNDTYEKKILASGSSFSTGATNLVTTLAPYTTTPGDIVYGCTATGAPYFLLSTNNVPAASTLQGLNLSGNYLCAGQRGAPLLLEVDATTTGNINLVTARMDP